MFVDLNYSHIYHFLRTNGGVRGAVALVYGGNFLENYIIKLHTQICINKWLDLSNILTFKLVPGNAMTLIFFDIILGFLYLYQLLSFHILINTNLRDFWVLCILSRLLYFDFISKDKISNKIRVFDEEKLDKSLRHFYKQFYFVFIVF